MTRTLSVSPDDHCAAQAGLVLQAAGPGP